VASSVADVREEIGDTTEPYLVSETRVQLALDEAADDLQARGVDLDTVQGSKAQRLMAAIELLEIHLARVWGRPAASISESGKSISYTDLAAAKQDKALALRRLLAKLAGSPMEIAYDNY
jgi:hypothetical protein